MKTAAMYQDLSAVDKYEISEEAYDKRKGMYSHFLSFFILNPLHTSQCIGRLFLLSSTPEYSSLTLNPVSSRYVPQVQTELHHQGR